MDIDKIIADKEKIDDVIVKYLDRWKEREKDREKVAMNASEHMDYLVSCIRDVELSKLKAIDMDMLLYSSNEDYVEFADTYSYLFDVLIAYARKNMLTLSNGDREHWFIVKHEDSFYEFNELHGQGSSISTRLLNRYEGPYFTLKQLQSGYEFDTAEAERKKMDMEFVNFLEERRLDGISENVMMEVLRSYVEERKI